MKVRYAAEEMWTGLKTDTEDLESMLTQESWSKTQLTSNPYRVEWLLTKLKDLKIQRQSLEKSKAFRPIISQVKSLLQIQTLPRLPAFTIIDIHS